MTKNLIYPIGILITILLGTYFYFTCCSTCGTEEVVVEKAITPVIPEATSYPFSFSDGDFSYDVNDNFNFNASSSTILLPLSAKVDTGIVGLKDFLANNIGKVFNITGYYKASEENNSVFPNLGLARANAVKNYLVEKGISSSSLNTSGKLMDEMVQNTENVFLGPIAYSISGQTEDLDNELKALYEKIKADPLIIYFETGEAAINLSAEQKQKVADISRYLDKIDTASSSVIGHTDNKGSRALNTNLGQERADFVKSYLINNGITASKISSSSKGPDAPIATNDTEEGRSKNRRTEVTLN